MQKYLDKKLRKREAKDGYKGKKFQRSKARWENRHQEEWGRMEDDDLLKDINAEINPDLKEKLKNAPDPRHYQ